MTSGPLTMKVETYVHRLCLEIPNRRVGSKGNQLATEMFAETVAAFGFHTDCPEFECIDWTHGDVHLALDGEPFEVFASPYSLGCHVSAPLAVASTIEALETIDVANKAVLLRGELAKEQLMPKNFPFYNPDEHQRIIHLLETKGPVAMIAATSRNPEMAGALYPFPLIEDGDFDIPSVYMTEEVGARLAAYVDREISLSVDANRVPSKGCNVIARKAGSGGRKIVLCAHIDTKAGTPGALDNATGIVVLLLLAELLEHYSGSLDLEIVAFNGEDYYSAPGQVQYLRDNQDRLDQLILGINLDGAGYHEGNTAYSLYNCPPELASTIREAFSSRAGIVEGEQWYQGDHMLFVLNHRPAVAVTSDAFVELWAQVAHTHKDRPELVDYAKLVSIALALRDLLVRLA